MKKMMIALLGLTLMAGKVKSERPDLTKEEVDTLMVLEDALVGSCFDSLERSKDEKVAAQAQARDIRNETFKKYHNKFKKTGVPDYMKKELDQQGIIKAPALIAYVMASSEAFGSCVVGPFARNNCIVSPLRDESGKPVEEFKHNVCSSNLPKQEFENRLFEYNQTRSHTHLAANHILKNYENCVAQASRDFAERLFCERERKQSFKKLVGAFNKWIADQQNNYKQ